MQSLPPGSKSQHVSYHQPFQPYPKHDHTSFQASNQSHHLFLPSHSSSISVLLLHGILKTLVRPSAVPHQSQSSVVVVAHLHQYTSPSALVPQFPAKNLLVQKHPSKEYHHMKPAFRHAYDMIQVVRLFQHSSSPSVFDYCSPIFFFFLQKRKITFHYSSTPSIDNP